MQRIRVNDVVGQSRSFTPQHFTRPVLSTEHEKNPPPATRTAELTLNTWAGRSWLFNVPFPSCPCALEPQHHTVPALRTAQVC
jgi:hypothetical protein